MYQILKIVGVSAEALPRLHAVLEGDMVKSKKPIWIGDTTENYYGFVKFAELLNSKYDAGNRTYTVVIKVWIRMPCRVGDIAHRMEQDMVYLPPLSILKAIYKALGEDLYPEEEKLIAAAAVQE